MGGRAEPPEGAPEGGSGGEDDFRPVVFDESFIRAARIQELSAQERMSAGTRPIRRRGNRSGGLPRQALALMLLVSLAFAAAVYMGSKHPYDGSTTNAAQLTMTVIPLQPGAGGIPTGARTTAPAASASGATASSSPSGSAGTPGSPSGTASGSASTPATASASGTASGSPSPSPSPTGPVAPGPFAGTPLADYLVGAAGIQLPFPRHTQDFTSDQVLHALKIVYNYLRASSLDPAVLMGGSTDSVRSLIAAGQHQQFDQSLSDPRDDQQHDVLGWLIRFDPSKVRLAAPDDIRLQGTLNYQQLNSGTLEVTSDYTFVYALTPAPAPAAATTPATPSATPSGGATPSGKATASGSPGAHPAGPATSPSATGSAAAQPVQQPTVLFTVRRQIRYQFTQNDLNADQVELVDSVVQAGPMACNADVSSYLQPIFPSTPAAGTGAATGAAGRHAGTGTTPAASPEPGPSVDPFDHTRPAWAVCGVLTGPTL